MLGEPWDLSALSREIAKRVIRRSAGDMASHYGDSLKVNEKGDLMWHSGGIFPYKIVTGNYLVEGNDVVVLVSTSAAPIDITLPPSAKEDMHLIVIKRLGTQVVTVIPDGTETIDGAASKALNAAYSTVGLIGSRQSSGYLILFDL